MEQRPHVRGSITEEYGDDGHHQPPYSPDGVGQRGGGAGTASKRAGRWDGGDVRDGPEPDHDCPFEEPTNHDSGSTRPEDADFLESLRGGEGAGAGAGAGSHRRRGNSGPGSCSSNGKQRARVRQARRPEWNSDTAAVASLGGGQAAILTDNSPAAVQVWSCGVSAVVIYG